jgi:type I restriction enzyme S subunit
LCAVIDHRGKTPRKLGGDFSDSGVRVLSAKNIVDGRITDEDIRYVSHDMWHRWMPVRLQTKDVLLTSEAPLGQVAILKDGAEYCLGQRLFALRANPSVLDAGYLYYSLQSPSMQHRLHARATGTTAQGIRQSELLKVEIDLLPLPEQRAIAHILGTLDDKIELNRCMNATLEAIAQALFTSWFVDFDPVRAKAEGRQPAGMDAETAALFPDGFEDSPLGEIPRGWEVGSIYDVAEVVYGAPFASRFFNADGVGLPLIRIRDLANHEPEVYTTETLPRQTRIRPGDIVVGMDGEFRVHHWRGPESLLNQRVCTFRPLADVPPLFVSEVIRQPLEFFERSKTGTTVIHLGKKDIDTFRIVVPSSCILSKFRLLTEPILDRIIANSQESRTLAATRDVLLPKLLSGEVRVGALGTTINYAE